MTIRLEGGRRLEAALRELGAQVAGRLGQNSVNAGARVIAAEAKKRAPVLTGALRKSIRVFTERTRASGSRTASIGSRARHAHLVEFGTRHMSAQPFLRTGAQASAQAAVSKIGENLAAGIAREVGKRNGR